MSNLEQTGDLTTERLELLAELVDRAWLDSQLKRYQRFRERYSISSRWWHRRPDVSPIVPLVFWAQPGPRLWLDAPFGVWRGNPSGILGRLLAAIVEFRDYWEQLPEGRGRGHLREALRHPWRLFGIRHELRLATHMKGAGCRAEPHFLNPVSEKGDADIVVDDGQRTYDVQCKARNPSVATNMPYDVYHYFAGAWARLVKDSERSYHLFLDVKRRTDQTGVNRLLDTIQSLLGSEVTVSGRLETDDWGIELMEMGYGPGQVTPKTLREMALLRADKSLYTDMELLRPASMLHSSPHVVSCHITGDRRHGMEHYVYSAAELAAKSHSGSNPLIVSVNLYQEADMSAYMNGPSVKAGYETWRERFFSRYPRVAMLILSSNYERYLPLGGPRAALGTKYLLVESPHWDGVLPQWV